MSDLQDQLRTALRPAIEELGQAETARLSGVPRPQISQWLSGHRGMSLDAIDRLAAAIRVHLVVTPKSPTAPPRARSAGPGTTSRQA